MKVYGTAEALRWINLWVERFTTEYGYNPMIYWSHRGVKHIYPSTGNLDTFPTWWAYYKESTWGQAPKLGKGFTDWTLRQFTSSGEIPGIKGKCDVNYFNGSLQDFHAWVQAFQSTL